MDKNIIISLLQGAGGALIATDEEVRIMSDSPRIVGEKLVICNKAVGCIFPDDFVCFHKTPHGKSELCAPIHCGVGTQVQVCKCVPCVPKKKYHIDDKLFVLE